MRWIVGTRVRTKHVSGWWGCDTVASTGEAARRDLTRTGSNKASYYRRVVGFPGLPAPSSCRTASRQIHHFPWIRTALPHVCPRCRVRTLGGSLVCGVGGVLTSGFSFSTSPCHQRKPWLPCLFPNLKKISVFSSESRCHCYRRTWESITCLRFGS